VDTQQLGRWVTVNLRPRPGDHAHCGAGFPVREMDMHTTRAGFPVWEMATPTLRTSYLLV